MGQLQSFLTLLQFASDLPFDFFIGTRAVIRVACVKRGLNLFSFDLFPIMLSEKCLPRLVSSIQFRTTISDGLKIRVLRGFYLGFVVWNRMAQLKLRAPAAPFDWLIVEPLV